MHLDVLRSLRHEHEIASVLLHLIEKDGAGSWPPLACHDSMPAPLQSYQAIYHEMSASLSTASPSLHDGYNCKRIDHFRSLMRKLLRERVSVRDVEDMMISAESDNWTILGRGQCNAFYCSIAVLRHAYRWATIPVVRVAQDERVIDFPESWKFLGNTFKGFLVINVGLSEKISSTEQSFFSMFYEVEVKALPLYCELVHAIVAYQRQDKESCLEHIQKMDPLVRELFQVIYQNLTNEKVSKQYWLRYCQGFQGWGLGKVVDGQFIRYDGLSGNHVLAFHVLDAFLGIQSYLSDEDMMRYIPARQRKFSSAVRMHSFRSLIVKDEDPEIYREITKIVNQMRLFRAAHRHRVMPYLKVPAPERQYMTAGKIIGSQGCVGSVDDALKPLDDMLVARLRQTM
ncbi:hypothetical protein PT974_11982 [Cladobotryum mycophilum]|uniref:Uncharacterized protein n=1 Tax=Cladobotryum mycophilum TaxID=491253 RepID=A0ABR0S6Q2_9HYPO